MASGTKGNCCICGAELGRLAMKTHILNAHASAEGGQDCRLLKIEGAQSKGYWIYIDVPADKTLGAVDKFMRRIWLECCGHLSAFYNAGHGQVAKSRKIGSFAVGDKLLHEYDFGSTTECLITFVGDVLRPPQKENVRLLARNTPPRFRCAECGGEAEYICPECGCYSEDAFYCAGCGEKHEHEDMLLPVTNSPRLGTCGYCGELDVYTYCPAPAGPGDDKA